MIRALLAVSLFALAACATPLPHVVERSGDTFDVRFDAAVQTTAQVDSVASAHCATGPAAYVSQETRFDGFAYRTYRCAPR